MTRIVVLGSSGFLGTALCKKLSQEKTTTKFMVHQKNRKLKKNEFFGDILQRKYLKTTLKNNDIVVNLIGQNNGNVDNLFDTNLKGSLNLLEIAKTKKNLKIIFASSINVYGDNCKFPSKETDEPNPMTNYGIIKLLTEQLYYIYSNVYGLDVTVLRFSNIYGKNKKYGIIPNILKSSSKKPVSFTSDGKQQRDFLFIDDAINAILNVIKIQPTNFQIFNICSSTKTSPKKIVQLIENISKKKIYYKFTKENVDEKCLFADYSKAKNSLNFKPTINLHNGLKHILID